MQVSTSVDFAYLLLCKGVHLCEIQRFVDAHIADVDVEADTIPAPPPSDSGYTDPDTRPTIPAPPMVPLGRLEPSRPASELLDFRGAPDTLWDELEGLVECAR